MVTHVREIKPILILRSTSVRKILDLCDVRDKVPESLGNFDGKCVNHCCVVFYIITYATKTFMLQFTFHAPVGYKGMQGTLGPIPVKSLASILSDERKIF